MFDKLYALFHKAPSLAQRVESELLLTEHQLLDVRDHREHYEALESSLQKKLDRLRAMQQSGPQKETISPRIFGSYQN